ncbi:ABC transporter substrate-binding protein [Streptomyces radicis]|uniref:ABC transporter substrate-binding protein n=1 Tax=Streptomyces radicis TaxID=1750517 RepID=UPI0015FFDAA1|nr:ABC transporter substrate-binding protein [Streptomyces radicis]
MPAPFARRSFLAGLGAIGAGALLAACSEGTSGSSDAAPAAPTPHPGPPTTGTPVRGGTLRVGVLSGGSAEVLDPAKASAWPDWPRIRALYDPLFRTVPGGIEPALAESAEAEDTAASWVFRLRRGVEWHDGRPFTADDVLYTLGLWAGEGHNYGPTAQAVIDFAGVRKLDSHTVRIPLLRPMAEFPSLTANFNALIVQDGATDFERPVGTGAFAYASFEPGRSSTFTAHRDHWGGEGRHVDELVFDSSFTDDAARANALRSGALDIVSDLSYTQAAILADDGDVVIGNSPGMAFQAFVMQVDQPPFDDVRVRQALKLLVDRPAMVSQTLAGYGTVGNDLVGKTLPHYAEDLTRERDVERARSLLREAGHEGLRLTLATNTGRVGFVEAATLFAQQAAEGGVEISVRKIDPGQWDAQRANEPLNMASWAGSASLTYFYATALGGDARNSETHWPAERGRDLLADAMGELDEAAAEEKWRAVQRQQFDEGGYIVFANRNYVDGYAPAVRGVTTDASGSTNNYDYSRAWLAS